MTDVYDLFFAEQKMAKFKILTKNKKFTGFNEGIVNLIGISVWPQIIC